MSLQERFDRLDALDQEAVWINALGRDEETADWLITRCEGRSAAKARAVAAATSGLAQSY